MQDNKIFKFFKNSSIALSIPLATFVLFYLLCGCKGVSYITRDTWSSFVENVFYVAFIAWGLFFNVPAGRFDFSVGAIMLLAPIIGANIALMQGFNAVGMLICCIVFGAILGMISGLLYVLLRLPAIIVSLGLALIYEALTFILFDARGVILIGQSKMLYMIKAPYIYIMGAIGLAILIVVVNKTKFGYHMRSLVGGQQIAVNTGINEQKNAVICYTISGALSSVAGMITLSRTGTLSASLGLSTVTAMFQGFLPMFVGVILTKYSESMIGIFLGSIVTSLIASGFAALGISLTVQNILNAFILLGFLVLSLNQNRFREMIYERKLKAKLTQ